MTRKKRVFFDGEDVCSGVEELFCNRTGPWPDFQYFIFGLDVGQLRDFCEDVLIDEEVLREPFAGRCSNFMEKCQ